MCLCHIIVSIVWITGNLIFSKIQRKWLPLLHCGSKKTRQLWRTITTTQFSRRASRSQHIHIHTLDIRYGTPHVYKYPRITEKKLTTPMLNYTSLYRNAYLRPQLLRTTPLDAIFLLPVWRKSSPNLHSLSLTPISRSRCYSTSSNWQMVQDRAMVTMAD